ncbi:CPBP family intramembrane glutamic endopeptidase [Crateriforma conspicua]|uniref:CPBP family intramembrane glutamic endopeptidase n=1 Tax=Crateriforma conspicua TaxID=2527996 RepID=UPI00118BCD8E|nr:CPBP family intramembrane glutamic endopeptidase [Crateriforma conspicua]QDV64350.1 CAAX amino terminal protease self- immunity [Crateriforma conspicua]
MDSHQSPSSPTPFAPPSPSDKVSGTDMVDPTESESSAIVARPRRIWPVFLVIAASLGTYMVASAAAFLLAIFVVTGQLSLDQLRDPDTAISITESRLGFPIVVVLPQFALIAPCIIAAWLSPVGFANRLGLRRGNWPYWAWVSAMLATPLVGMTSGLVGGLFFEESDHLKELTRIFRQHGTDGFLIPLALMIGATPAICEELLFRGYVQTRLTDSLGRWFGGRITFPVGRAIGALLGLIIASLVFAAFHMDPVHVVTVFPIGLFLGWVAYQSGSIYPAMLGHFANNTLSVVITVLAPEEMPDTLALPSVMFAFAIFSAGMLGLAGSVLASLLFSQRPDHELI